jgi:hypothetical protein
MRRAGSRRISPSCRKCCGRHETSSFQDLGLRGPLSLGFPRDSVSGLSLRMSRQVISFRGQRLKRRLVAQFLIPRSVHRSGADAIIDLNQAVDSSVDASCHARKIRREPPTSNDRDSSVSNRT